MAIQKNNGSILKVNGSIAKECCCSVNCPASCSTCGNYAFTLNAGIIENLCIGGYQYTYEWDTQELTLTWLDEEWAPPCTFASNTVNMTMKWKLCDPDPCPCPCAGDWTIEDFTDNINLYCSGTQWGMDFLNIGHYVPNGTKAGSACSLGVYNDGSVVSSP